MGEGQRMSTAAEKRLATRQVHWSGGGVSSREASALGARFWAGVSPIDRLHAAFEMVSSWYADAPDNEAPARRDRLATGVRRR